MQEIGSILKYLADTNTINFLIMAGLLCWICKKINLKSSLNKSVDEVSKSIDNSESEKKSASETLQEAKDTLERLPEEIKELEEQTKEKIDILCSKVEEAAASTIDGINLNAEKSVKLEEKNISNALTFQTISESINLSKVKIENSIKENPDLHLKFIEESLEKLERVSL